MDLGLSGKVAVVSGASRGIGRSIALTLASEGAHLCICARNADGLEKAAAEMREVGAEVEAIALDVTATEGAEALIGAAVSQFGGVDILVNNVGGSVWTPFAEITDDEWNHVLNLSFMSAVRLSRAAFPKWKSVVEEALSISPLFLAEKREDLYPIMRPNLP